MKFKKKIGAWLLNSNIDINSTSDTYSLYAIEEGTYSL